MTQPLLSLTNLQVARDSIKALDLGYLDIQPGEVLAVIGPNGAGKSTLMMSVSGLIPITAGEICFKGQLVHPHKDLAYRRRLSIVMQAPLLLHATVFQNVAAGLQFRRVGSREINLQVAHWLEKLGIQHLRDRQAARLSGGEAQRVSLARALVLQPDLMLLDEPFSALDAPTRARLIADLKHLLDTNRVTTLFITHDLDEAVALADRVAVLMDGKLRQVGTPREVFSTPTDPEVARFTGIETIIPGTIIQQTDGLVEVECDHHHLQAVSSSPIGAQVFLCLRPEDITLSNLPPSHPTSARNVLNGKIELLVTQGPLVRVLIDGPIRLTALITRASALEMNLAIGQQIWASFKTTAIHVIDL
jgi:tungstate transport system ATP-binding protein